MKTDETSKELPMTEEAWEDLRMRAVAAAFQTGRPVLANTDEKLRYADGSREDVPANVGVPQQPLPRAMALGHSGRRVLGWTVVVLGLAVLPWNVAVSIAVGAIVALVCGLIVRRWLRVSALPITATDLPHRRERKGDGRS